MEKRYIQAEVSVELFRRFKILTFNRNLTTKEAVNEAITLWLETFDAKIQNIIEEGDNGAK